MPGVTRVIEARRGVFSKPFPFSSGFPFSGLITNHVALLPPPHGDPERFRQAIGGLRIVPLALPRS